MGQAATERSGDARAPVVLVVDDDEAIRTVVRWQLDDAGFRVVEADDGPTALRRIRDDHPTLVVLDLSLPGLGGLDVLRSVRGGRVGRSDTPIIVLSGRNGETDRIVGLDLGADDYLVKPFSRASSPRGCARSCGGRRPSWPRRRSRSRTCGSSRPAAG